MEEDTSAGDSPISKNGTNKYETREERLLRKKRHQKLRKFKPDDIRKKIKARFHKTIKNAINEFLKFAGSEKFFDFLPQSFICNISREKNKEVLHLTYKELLRKDFLSNIDESKYKKKKVDQNKYINNIEVLKYLENNPEISRNSGFDILGNVTYAELLNIYFDSFQFEKSIQKLKEENESEDYIREYYQKAKTYVRFFME